ncbi:MAG TPA: cyclic dehypoxanthinyl futalosine synthase [Candidatus Thermoplasmatota archaeon]|nr:cyclic dehypoxanthinyl futalosine synthase [Candidatus Thermoplasmatota archaeon]
MIQATTESAQKDVLDRAARGERISIDEALLLVDAPYAELADAANRRREAVTDPAVATYVVDRNINYTNVCNVLCDFCGFYRTGKEKDAYTLTIDQILHKIEPLVAQGGTQVLLQGGLNPDLPVAFIEQMFRAVRERFPTIDIHSLTATEIEFYAKAEGVSHRTMIERLRAAGLKSLPGGGMEILVDEWRDKVSPLKTRSQQYLDIHEECHKLGMTTTATMMFGMGETWRHRLQHLDSVRAVQDRSQGRTPQLRPSRGFTAFIPWTFQTDGSTRLKHAIAPADEYLRVIAISRLFLDNFAHIQAGWVTEGPKIAQAALHGGADDWGGVLMEENVISAAGTLFGMTPAHARRFLREGGYVPAQRDTYYRIVRRFDEATSDERVAPQAPERLDVHLGKVGNRGRGAAIRLNVSTPMPSSARLKGADNPEG